MQLKIIVFLLSIICTNQILCYSWHVQNGTPKNLYIHLGTQLTNPIGKSNKGQYVYSLRGLSGSEIVPKKFTKLIVADNQTMTQNKMEFNLNDDHNINYAIVLKNGTYALLDTNTPKGQKEASDTVATIEKNVEEEKKAIEAKKRAARTPAYFEVNSFFDNVRTLGASYVNPLKTEDDFEKELEKMEEKGFKLNKTVDSEGETLLFTVAIASILPTSIIERRGINRTELQKIFAYLLRKGALANIPITNTKSAFKGYTVDMLINSNLSNTDKKAQIKLKELYNEAKKNNKNI